MNDYISECRYRVEFPMGPAQNSSLLSPYFNQTIDDPSMISNPCIYVEITQQPLGTPDFDVAVIDSDGNVLSPFAGHPVLPFFSPAISYLYVSRVAGNNLRLRITAYHYVYHNCTPFCAGTVRRTMLSTCVGENLLEVIR